MRLAISVFHSPYVYTGPDTIAWTKPCIYCFLCTLSLVTMRKHTSSLGKRKCVKTIVGFAALRALELHAHRLLKSRF
jgi:hypothetical protein